MSVESLNTEKENLRSALEQVTESNNAIKLDLDSADNNNKKITTELEKVNLEKDRLIRNVRLLFNMRE